MDCNLAKLVANHPPEYYLEALGQQNRLILAMKVLLSLETFATGLSRHAILDRHCARKGAGSTKLRIAPTWRSTRPSERHFYRDFFMHSAPRLAFLCAPFHSLVSSN